MKLFFPVLLPFVFIAFPFAASVAQGSNDALRKVVIIRHGEKPDQGDNLNCQGLNRALKLVNVLHQKLGTPNDVYVPAINTGKSTSTARMYQTIVPFAVKYNVNINSKYDVKDAENLVNSVKKKSGTVLLVWEHKAVEDILKNFGIKNPPEWKDDDFDTMLIITFSKGKALLAKDRENITPAPNCPE